jgi:hypothetical protein
MLLPLQLLLVTLLLQLRLRRRRKWMGLADASTEPLWEQQEREPLARLTHQIRRCRYRHRR